MPHYRVLLEGRNFWLQMDGKPERLGFHTTRFVEAANQAQAELTAVNLLRAEGRLTPLNDHGDSPSVFVDEIEEVGREEIPDVVPGFAFFADEQEPDA